MAQIVDIPTLCDAEDFLREPIGAATGTPRMLFWFPSASLRILSVWGRPTIADMDLMIRLLRCQCAPERSEHSSFIDVSGLTELDRAPFERFTSQMKPMADSFARVVTRSAMVHTGGPAQSAVAGYPQLIGAPIDIVTFRDPAKALNWLGAGDRAADLLDGLAALRRQADGTPPVLYALRHELRTNLAKTSLPMIASRLGTSTRSLQRVLRVGKTTYRDEVQRAKIERAKELLATTDRKLFDVAVDVGFASLQSFSDAFQTRVRTRPSAWRARRRGVQLHSPS